MASRPARPVMLAVSVTAVLAATLTTMLGVAGCAVGPATSGMARPAANSDRTLVAGYFQRLNAAGEQGLAAQRAFFSSTQHPDFLTQTCDLGAWTVQEQPAWTTFRLDPDWTPSDAGSPPRGTVYLIAVSITIRNGHQAIGDQIGAEHVVLLNGEVYGFAPCASA
ncbi:MAG TPA: hypothetical protein VF444_15120 [Pseudonocardiaceae bacterium]